MVPTGDPLRTNLPEFGDLATLSYTGMVAEETLRLYPVNIFLERQAVRDTEPGGYRIAADTPVFLAPYTIHRNPDYWSAPAVILLERHAPESAASRPRYANSSFGCGRRCCIGDRLGRLEAVLTLTMVSQKFPLESSDGFPDIQALPAPVPMGGMPMQLIARCGRPESRVRPGHCKGEDVGAS